MNYIEALKNHQLKVTPQRLEIVDIIYKYGHINIDKLYSLLLVKFPTLSLATIYKNINKMSKNLFLSEVKIPNKKNVYELSKQEHCHIVCTNCNEIVDINIDISNIVNDAQKNTKYNIKKSSIIFEGFCSECQNNN